MEKTLTPADVSEIADAALSLVVKERRRQIDELGYTEDHDNRHLGEQLASAAAFFLLPQYLNIDVCAVSDAGGLALVPLGEIIGESAWDGIHRDEYDSGVLRHDVAIDTRINQLVKGVALGLAELERWMRERDRRDLAEKP